MTDLRRRTDKHISLYKKTRLEKFVYITFGILQIKYLSKGREIYPYPNGNEQ